MDDRKPKTILLVEDEAIIGLMERTQLEREGYRALHVPSGEAAVEMVRAGAERIDLVLMDIDLGAGMDGTEAARAILESKRLPLIFLSSHTEKETVRKTEEITNYGYVVKNSSITVLDASIKMAFKLFDAYRDNEAQKSNLEAANEELNKANQSLRHSEARLLESEASVRNKLDAILEPSGDIAKLELADIIDAKALQSLMEDFHALTGILGAILDLKGKVLVAVGWQDICTMFHRRNPETAEFCLESDTILTMDVPFGTSREYRCKNNMVDVVTPLVVNDRHIGNIFIGQFIYEDERYDIDFFRNQARRYGFDEAEYLAALDRVPRFSRQKAEKGIAFYSKVAKLVSSLSYSSIQLSRIAAERKVAEDEKAALLAEKSLVLKEVNHRIKNNMLILTSLLSMERATAMPKDADAVLDKVTSRMRSMMLLYDRLYQAESPGEIPTARYLPDLLRDILDVSKISERVALAMEIEDFILDSKRLQLLGIIMNELVANAMKYAFAPGAMGTIAVSMRLRDGNVGIVFRDDGSGITDAALSSEAPGFGLKLIDTLVRELRGTLRIERDKGTKVSIEFAL